MRSVYADSLPNVRRESPGAELLYDESTLRKCLAALYDVHHQDDSADYGSDDYVERATALFLEATCDSVWNERVMSWDGETILGLHTLSHTDFLELQSFLGSWMLLQAENGESMMVTRDHEWPPNTTMSERSLRRNWLFHTMSDNVHLEPAVFLRWVRAWVLIQPRGVNKQSRDWDYLYPPLHLAVGHGEVSVVETLLQAGARINTHDNEGRTALHFVQRSVSQVTETIMLLVKYGADVASLDMYLRSALHSAVRSGKHIVVCALLAATDKATRQQQHAACDISFETPFISACNLPPGKNAEHIIKLLLADGCDPDSQPPTLNEPGVGKIMLSDRNIHVAIRWGSCAAAIKLPLCNLDQFLCMEQSVIPGGYIQDWDAFFRRFLEENNGAVFKTATRVNDFDIWFKRANDGTWPVLCQAHGPFKLSFRIPSPSPVMQFYRPRNRRHTAAHSIVYTSSLQHTASPCVVGHALKKLQLLHGLCNPLVTCASGKTVAEMFAEHIKTVGADWLVNNTVSMPRLHTTVPNRLPMVLHANILLWEAEQARDFIALSQQARVGANSGLLSLGSEMIQMVFEIGHLGHTVD